MLKKQFDCCFAFTVRLIMTKLLTSFFVALESRNKYTISSHLKINAPFWSALLYMDSNLVLYPTTKIRTRRDRG